MAIRTVWSSDAPQGSITLVEITDDRRHFGLREQVYEFVCGTCGHRSVGLSWQEARREAVNHRCPR